MTRAEMLSATKNLVNLIEETGVSKALGDLLRSAPDRDNKTRLEVAIKVLHRYSVEFARLGSLERRIAEMLGIGELSSPVVFTWLVNSTRDETSEAMHKLHTIYLRLHFVEGELPKLIDLIQPDVYRQPTIVARIGRDEVAILRLIILEQENRLSSATRVINALDSIRVLYEAVADLNQSRKEDLAVVACDSGSDKTVDFLGAAKIVQGVKEIILALWDRIVFYRERKIEARLSLVAESLPIIERIGELQKNGSIGPEQAELLRRQILNGTEKFLTSGASIPEIQEASMYDPRKLMAPEPKLLVGEVATSVENDLGTPQKRDKPRRRRRSEDTPQV